MNEPPGASTDLLLGLFWACAAGCLLGLIVLATWRRLYPTPRLVIYLCLPLLASLGLVWRPEWAVAVIALDGLGVVVALLDARSLPGRTQLRVARTALRIASLNYPLQVNLTVTNDHPRSLDLVIRDDRAPHCDVSPAEFVVHLEPESQAEFTYACTPRRRGTLALQEVFVQVRSRWGWWHRYLRLPCVSEVYVYPDLKQLSEYSLLARTDRLSLMGLRRARTIGQDHDFERLRDYTRDDHFRQIDWRATARRRKLTVKDFQTSQSQRMLLMLDCGRMMTNVCGDMTLFDHALNAALMLGYVALQRGDRVGLICFSDRIHTYVPPRGGLHQMQHLLHASFDRFPEMVESRYDLAYMYLGARCRKRSLAILLTNVIDAVNTQQIRDYLATQAGHHLTMAVLLRDHGLFDAVADEPARTEAVYAAGSAADMLVWRRGVLRDLAHSGSLVLDVFPEDLTAELVNEYLRIKARHLL